MTNNCTFSLDIEGNMLHWNVWVLDLYETWWLTSYLFNEKILSTDIFISWIVFV